MKHVRDPQRPHERALDPARLPRHIAIIMDGNGRWAKKRGLPRAMGHRAGTEAVRAIIRSCDRLGIEALSIYAFSTENWKRSTEEVGVLMGLLLSYFRSEIDELDANDVCIRILGDIDGLPRAQRDAVLAAMDRTRHNAGLKLNIAINYGGRDELRRTMRALAEDVRRGTLDPGAIDEAMIDSKLDTRDLPDVDLLIRTSGEMRVSNFLLWQIAYAEFVVTDTLWPDFDDVALCKAIAEYQTRDRRFGGRPETALTR